MAKRPPKKSATGPANWLVCFDIDEPDEHTHVGSFQVMVNATSCEDALDQCEEKLREANASGKLFTQPCTIYFLQAIRLPPVVAAPTIVNFSDVVVYEHDRCASITCAVADEGNEDFESYSLGDTKGEQEEAFLDFGGKRFRATLDKALGREKDETQPPIVAAAKRRRRTHWKER